MGEAEVGGEVGRFPRLLRQVWAVLPLILRDGVGWRRKRGRPTRDAAERPRAPHASTLPRPSCADRAPHRSAVGGRPAVRWALGKSAPTSARSALRRPIPPCVPSAAPQSSPSPLPPAPTPTARPNLGAHLPSDAVRAGHARHEVPARLEPAAPRLPPRRQAAWRQRTATRALAPRSARLSSTRSADAAGAAPSARGDSVPGGARRDQAHPAQPPVLILRRRRRRLRRRRRQARPAQEPVPGFRRREPVGPVLCRKARPDHPQRLCSIRRPAVPTGPAHGRVRHGQVGAVACCQLAAKSAGERAALRV
jgi:hypothetical protein